MKLKEDNNGFCHIYSCKGNLWYDDRSISSPLILLKYIKR